MLHHWGTIWDQRGEMAVRAAIIGATEQIDDLKTAEKGSCVQKRDHKPKCLG